VVGDGLAVQQAEAAPALALRRLQPFDQVEEGDGRGGLRCEALRERGKYWDPR